MAEKLRILVVDDSKVVRKAFARILSADYDLIEAEDGEGAWEKLNEEQDICAVFTDLSMPHLDGIGLIERIRASEDPEIKALPIVLVTAAGEGDDTTKLAITSGANDYILKPFDSVFLLSKVQTYVQPRETGLNDSKLATLDPLTKLANKTYFYERGGQEVSAANRHKTELALLIIQLDDFEGLKEKAEEKITRAIIRKLGTYISSEVRLEDTVARIERDRFALIMSETGLPPAVEMAERVREKVENKTIKNEGTSFNITVSVGISVLPPEVARTIEMLMMDADRHLREVIKQGGNGVIPKLIIEKAEKATISTSLDDALGILRRRNEKMSTEQAAESLHQLLPLLDYCNEVLELDMAEKIKELHQKFNKES